MQNYSGSTSNALYFSSSEATTAANRPILNVTYCTAGVNYTLSVGHDDNGTVEINPESDTYEYGAVVTLTPIPASGYEFAYWSGADEEDPWKMRWHLFNHHE
jgi:hypothetical protein